jgi:hypothetical protein
MSRRIEPAGGLTNTTDTVALKPRFAWQIAEHGLIRPRSAGRVESAPLGREPQSEPARS